MQKLLSYHFLRAKNDSGKILVRTKKGQKLPFFVLKWGFLRYFLTVLPNYHFFLLIKSFFYIGGIGGGYI